MTVADNILPTLDSTVSNKRRLATMTAVVLATLMSALDASFIPIAFPDMIDKLDTSTSMVVWVALGYLIAATGPMLFLVRVSETYGQVRLFQIGIVIFSIAMTLCAWAPNIFWLTVLRIIQGIGMAMFMPGTFALAARVYPKDQMGRAMGILQAANSGGFLLGPVFGGFLLDAFDWTAIFMSRIPLALIAIIAAFLAFGLKQDDFESPKERRDYDPLGAIYLTIALFGLLFGANRLPVEDNHLEMTVWLIFLGGFAAFALFLREENRSKDPLVDLNLFRHNQTFTKAAYGFTTAFASYPVYMFVLPLLLITGLEMRAWDVGIVMCTAAIATQICSPFAGRLGDKYGAELMALIGTALTAAGYLGMLVFDVDSSVAILYIPMVIMGIGNAFFFAPNNGLIMTSVPPEQSSMASGMIGTLRQTGYAFGFAVIASLYTAIQDVYEASITYFSIDILEPETADVVSTLFDNGSILSPEITVYVFQITVIICTAILICPLIASIPNIKLKGYHYGFISAAALGIAALGTAFFMATSDLTPSEGSTGIKVSTTIHERKPIEAFGMTSRSVTLREPSVSETNSFDGETVFFENCSACHGEDAMGIDDFGVQLHDSAFITAVTDDELINFIKQGRDETHDNNTTGLIMPPIDYLEDGEYKALITYLRTLDTQ